MDISYTAAKSEMNIARRDLSFESVVRFDMAGALIVEDTRVDYAEQRFQALGMIGERLHMLVFTPRDQAIHVISLRKANSREVQRYEQALIRHPAR